MKIIKPLAISFTVLFAITTAEDNPYIKLQNIFFETESHDGNPCHYSDVDWVMPELDSKNL